MASVFQNQLDRHEDAMKAPKGPFETNFLSMFHGWRHYATAHRQAYGSPIGDDGVLGDDWEQIGKSLIALLNGATDRLDCGTLDREIRRTLTANGFDGDSA